MYLRYDDLISEPADELLRVELQHRRSPVAARVRMLRLLKSGAYRSRRALAAALGYSERQLHRWFETYRQDGLDALLDYEISRGSRERVTPEAWAALEAEMKAGRIGGLQQAQRYLADEHGITYSVGGISALFQRRKTKLKTGRPRHVKASADEQEAWKKTVR